MAGTPPRRLQKVIFGHLRFGPGAIARIFHPVFTYWAMGLGGSFERTLPMAGQQIGRLDFADRSRRPYPRVDHEAQSGLDGFYFEFSGRCRRLAAAIPRTVANVIQPSDQLFGSYSTAVSFTPADLRFAWVGVIASITGLAALLLLGWNEIGVGPASATVPGAPSSSPVAAPQVETQADRMEAIRRRGLELLRADFPEDEPSPSLARGDRLEVHDETIKPVTRIATAGEGEGSVVPSALLPTPARPAANKPAEAKEKHAVEERPAHRRHPRRASRHQREQVRMAQAKYAQVPGEPQGAVGGALQPPPEENKVFGWVTRLPDAIVPSSWKGGWENLWTKGNGG
jgi:hypothetical protein